MPPVLYSQSVYDGAAEETAARKSFQRERWFYEQRMYPENFIPVNAYINAVRQKRAITTASGYYNKTGNWFSIGPTPGVNTYYGNVSSRVATVKFHPTNPDIIYLGAACGGVWKTTNDGQNWVSKTDFEISLSSGALAIDAQNPEVVYCGTGEATYFTYSYYGAGLLKSTNGGDTWTNYRAGLPSMTYFSRLVIKPGNSNILFAALGGAGLYRSTDAGESWSAAVSGRCDDIVFTPDGQRAYITGVGSGYRISTDGGESFVQSTPFAQGTRSHLALCKTMPEVIYASVYNSSGNTVNVYKSTDAGVTYSLLANTFTGTTQGWYDFYVHVNPFDANYAYVGLVDLWRTTNGSAFTKITNTSAGPVHVDHHNMDFHPSDAEKLICSNDGGVYFSTNRGTNWINLNATLNLTQFYRVAADPVNAAHVLGGTQDNGVQQTQGSPVWTVQIFGGDGGDVCFDTKLNNYIITENQNNLLRRSINGGQTWTLDTTGLSGTPAWIAPIIAHPDSTGVFYTARQRVFRSSDYGDTWTGISSGTSGTIRELAISRTNPQVMYASTTSAVYISNDGGKTFTSVSTGLPVRTITSISVHPDSSGTALVTFSGFGGGHVFKTTNAGASWKDVSGNLPDTPVNDGLMYYPGFSTNIMLAATDVGVFVTDNGGSTWSELANGLPNTVAMHFDYHKGLNKLRIATHGRGVWEYSGSLVSAGSETGTVPKDFVLYQNYPNPFNPVTVIKYSVPYRAHVRVTVVDALGREVETIADKEHQPGNYEFVFSGAELNSGVYFCHVVAGDFKGVRKMVLLR